MKDYSRLTGPVFALQDASIKTRAEALLKAHGRTMAVESFSEMDMTDNLTGIVIRSQDALTEINRRKGIDYSTAILYSDVLGMEATPESFTQMPSKQNLEMATENLKTIALVALTAIAIAGIGFVVYKMLSTSKRSINHTAQNEKVVKNVQAAAKKATEVVNDNKVSYEVSSKILDILRNEVNPELAGSITDPDNVIPALVVTKVVNGGIPLGVVSRYGRGDDQWLFKLFLENKDDIDAINIMTTQLTTDLLASGDVDESLIQNITNRIQAVRLTISDQVSRWLKWVFPTYTTSVTDPENEVYQVRGLDGNRYPELLFDRVKDGISTPNEKEINQYNDLLKAMGKNGKKAEALYKKISDKFEIDPESSLGKLLSKDGDLARFYKSLDGLAEEVTLEINETRTAVVIYQECLKRLVEIVKTVTPELSSEVDQKNVVEIIKKSKQLLGTTRMATESLQNGSLEDVLMQRQSDLHLNAIVPVDEAAADLDNLYKMALEYNALPELEQAGYRFCLEHGDGASVMATESWGTAAKVAVIIGGSVIVLGIGAMIASSLLKKTSSAVERHVSPEVIKDIAEKWNNLDARRENLLSQVSFLSGSIGVRPKISETYPGILDRVRKIGDEVRVQEDDKWKNLKELLKANLSEKDVDELSYGISQNGWRSIHTPPSVGHHVVKGAKEIFENIVKEPLARLSNGASPEDVLSKMKDWMASRGNEIREDLIYSTEHITEEDTYERWFMKGHGNSLYEAPLDYLDSAGITQRKFLETHTTINKIINEYVLDERTLDRYRKLAEQSKGSRDAMTSIVAIVDSFKKPFAEMIRLFRTDLECAERYLNFIDRLVKLTRDGAKDAYDRLAELAKNLNKEQALFDEYMANNPD